MNPKRSSSLGLVRRAWAWLSSRTLMLILGVIGLTTALKIQEQGGYQVTIIAEVIPSDAKTIKYTSHWAVSSSRNSILWTYRFWNRSDPLKGAHHVFNIRKDQRQYSSLSNSIWQLDDDSLARPSELERDTFDVLWELSKPGSDVEGCLLRTSQTEYYGTDGVRPPLESMPDVFISSMPILNSN